MSYPDGRRWLVQGYYLEDWPDEGDESEGVTDLIVAPDEPTAKAEYRKVHDPGNACSSVIAWGESEWNEHHRRDAAYIQSGRRLGRRWVDVLDDKHPPA